MDYTQDKCQSDLRSGSAIRMTRPQSEIKFSRNKHQAPRFSAAGKEIPCTTDTDNILASDVKIPGDWSRESAHKILESRMTKRKLEVQRK